MISKNTLIYVYVHVTKKLEDMGEGHNHALLVTACRLASANLLFKKFQANAHSLFIGRV